MLADFVGDKHIQDITVDDMRAWIRSMAAAGRKRNTVKRKIHTCSTFWAWLNVRGLVADNMPAKVLRLLPRKIHKRHYVWLSVDELNTFVKTPAESVRDQLAWLLLAWLGLRRMELLGLQISNIRMKDKQLDVVGKSQQQRTLPISRTMKPLIMAVSLNHPAEARLLRASNGDAWSPDSFSKAFSRHVARCGFDKHVTPHTLRHTFATHLVQRGVPIATVKDLMGHESIHTTMIYSHHAPEHLKAALKSHPLAEGD